MKWQTNLRFIMNWMVPVLLGGLYGHATFIDPVKFVAEGASAVEPGTDPAVTWSKMSATARGLGPQLGAWAICYSIVVGGFLLFEPTQRTHQLMARIQAFIMLIWWPAVWFGAMAPNPDFAPMTYETYLQQMSVGETVLGLLYVYCGWFITEEEEERNQKSE